MKSRVSCLSTQPHSHTTTQPHCHTATATATQPHIQPHTHGNTRPHTHTHTNTHTATRHSPSSDLLVHVHNHGLSHEHHGGRHSVRLHGAEVQLRRWCRDIWAVPACSHPATDKRSTRRPQSGGSHAVVDHSTNASRTEPRCCDACTLYSWVHTRRPRTLRAQTAATN